MKVLRFSEVLLNFKEYITLDKIIVRAKDQIYDLKMKLYQLLRNLQPFSSLCQKWKYLNFVCCVEQKFLCIVFQ